MDYYRLLYSITRILEERRYDLKKDLEELQKNNDKEFSDLINSRIEAIDEAREEFVSLIANVICLSNYTTIDYLEDDHGDKPTLINNIDAPIEDFEKIQNLLSKARPEYEIKK